MDTEFTKIMRQHNLRITIPRKTVFTALRSSAEALDIASILKLCPAIDRTSVYRTLEAFHAIGIVAIVHVGWKKRYELTNPLKPHHHHLHCTSCGQLSPIHSVELEAFIHTLAAKAQFTPSSHQFEINGLCRNCYIPNSHSITPHKR